MSSSAAANGLNSRGEEYYRVCYKLDIISL